PVGIFQTTSAPPPFGGAFSLPEEIMMMKAKFLLAGLVVAASCAMASAQQAQTVRLRGTIAKVDGNSLVLKISNGEEAKLSLAANAQIVAVVKASMADIKENTFL